MSLRAVGIQKFSSTGGGAIPFSFRTAVEKLGTLFILENRADALGQTGA